MKTFLKILKIILATTGLLIVAVIAIIGFVWTQPQKAWQLVESKIFPPDLKVTWQNLDVSVRKLEGFDFAIDIQMNQLLIRKNEPRLSIPLRKAQAKISISPFKKDKRIIIHELTVLSDEEIFLRPSLTKSEQTQKNPYQMLEEYSSYLNWIQTKIPIEKVYAEIQKLRLRLENKEIVLSARLTQDDKDWGLVGVGEFQSEYSFEFTFQAEVPNLMDASFRELTTSSPTLKGIFTMRRENVKVLQNFELYEDESSFSILSHGDLRIAKIKIKPTMKIQLSSRSAILSLNLAVDGLPGPIQQISDITADITSPFEQNQLLSTEATFFSVFLPIKIDLADRAMRRNIEESCQCQLPRSLFGKIRGHVYLARLFETPAETQEVLTADLSVSSIKNSFLTLDMGAHLDILKNRSDYELFPRVNSFAVIHSFRILRKILDSKNILVPAPLDVLDGKIYLSTHKETLRFNQGFSLPIQALVKLKSKSQQVDLTADAQVGIFPSIKRIAVDGAVFLKQLKLELPPLSPLGGKPRILKDARILTKPKPEKEKTRTFDVSIGVNIHTSQPGAIQLLSKYFEPFLPVTANITASFENIRGIVKAEPFGVEYLRRKFHVESMRIDISKPDQKAYPISGRLRVRQTLYTVFIDLEGTTNQPLVRFRSEPYLPEDDVISVLLFDRTRSELGQMDAESAGGFQAAVSDRAIGLFGLWAFASTPIRSFYYNPATKVYSATLVLANDVAASIGTDWENATQIELRKRISNQWILAATWVPETASTPETNKLQLLWQKRF